MPSWRMERDGDRTRPEEAVPQSMAFTVTFDSEKTSSNKFVKRHIRNLSLPLAKVYDNKVTTENTINGKPVKKPGNHSEGYFSSDPDEEIAISNISSSIKNGRMMAEEACRVSNKREEMEEEEEEEEEDEASDVASETGTYTIEKESPEIITARLSIDANFGVQHDGKHGLKPKVTERSSRNKTENVSRESTTWINEWATQVVNHNKSISPSLSTTEHHSKTSITKSHVTGVSKIPSPLTTRARFGVKSAKSKTEEVTTVRNQSVHRSAQRTKEECSDSSLETESYLKTTEKVMSAIAARMSLSLDSGGESDVDTRGAKTGLQHSDSSASESNAHQSTTSTTTRYNRAFSLRRGRLDEGGHKKVERSPPGSGNVGVRSTARKAVLPTPSPTSAPPPRLAQQKPPQPLSRNDSSRLSVRSKTTTPQTPSISGPNNGLNSVKKKVGGGSGGRSNSTLSSKEVEFQNWKRRKSYDPMKAAAEGKKKEAAKKHSPNIMTQSTTNATTTPKSPVNSVLRSASFHGTRQLGGASSSEEDEELTLSAEEDDYPLPQAPKTSLENSPRGSRVSLYNNSNTSPRTRHKLEGVDNLVVSAIHGMSNKLKGTASSLLKKLRYLYDEESEKNKQLSCEIEQLELGEASSPHKSPSKELASTLRNLKKLDATLRVLDEVLFDEADYE